jgi:amylosucrase
LLATPVKTKQHDNQQEDCTGGHMDSESLFDLRWERSEKDLLFPLRELYGLLPEFEKRLQHLILSHWNKRSLELKAIDLRRDLNPEWFLSEKMVGYVFYIDRFAGDLKGVLKHIDYLKSLGVTYVHFMPCLNPRPGDSDGGYSVMDYRSIDPKVGTMTDFEHVASELRKHGMDVCIDLVLNHTAKEHAWAEKAKRGDKAFQDYYWMFDSDEIPKAYDETLVEIFPDTAPGSFTFYPEFKKWVWTTFNEHQWDLNWTNPQVFLEIVDIMLTLANKGATCLRLDAVAFMWKRMGTNCQNQPEVHDILQALRAATRIAAPAMIHKAEAIVAPKDLVPYLGQGRHAGREANLAYHNNLMVQYWASLATRDTRLMAHVLSAHFPASFKNACFATYIRCHDDIGWAITEEDAAAVPDTSGPGHRRYLADFYSGKHPGTFARGGVFQENEETGDRRNSGSFASLAGLESALHFGDAAAVETSIHRILLGYAIICSFGGLPLLYMGDEIGLLNDYSFSRTAEHAHDNRWMHRPQMDWKMAANPLGPAKTLLAGVKHIIARRKNLPQFAASSATHIVMTGNDAVFAFVRESDIGPVVCVYNFSDVWQNVSSATLRSAGVSRFWDELGEGQLEVRGELLAVAPYGRLWMI